ncbi:hypothetical protein BJV74DRAFT_864972 [Russula compacta]|nr:hypothetical protein BJV74DRAFT_864972 [Russula compacta]
MFPSLPSLAAALSQPFKRSQLGLFHGKTKQYGNNVPFSKNKTRRAWLPNINPNYGGLDQYVLNTKSDSLGWEGMRLRVAVREALERKALEVSSSPPGVHRHGTSQPAW